MPGPLCVTGFQRLFGFGNIGSQIAAGCDHVSTKTHSALVHLLLQGVHAALDRGGSSVEMVNFSFHRVEQSLMLEQGHLLGIDLLRGRAVGRVGNRGLHRRLVHCGR